MNRYKSCPAPAQFFLSSDNPPGPCARCNIPQSLTLSTILTINGHFQRLDQFSCGPLCWGRWWRLNNTQERRNFWGRCRLYVYRCMRCPHSSFAYLTILTCLYHYQPEHHPHWTTNQHYHYRYHHHAYFDISISYTLALLSKTLAHQSCLVHRDYWHSFHLPNCHHIIVHIDTHSLRFVFLFLFFFLFLLLGVDSN